MNRNNPIRSTRSMVTAAVAGAFVAVSALMPQPVLAVPTLVFSDVTYDAFAEIVHPSVATYLSKPPVARLAFDDPSTVEAFVTPAQFGPGWNFLGFGYGLPTNHPTEAFASARNRNAGVIDLGASGSSEGPGLNDWGRITADMITTGRVTNTGTYGAVPLTYTIPRIEIDQRGTRFDGLVAQVDVNMQLAMYDVTNKLLFDFSRHYTLSFDYFKPPTTFAILTYTASQDLLNDSAGLVNVQNPGCLGCQGKAVGQFDVFTEYVLDTGDYLAWTIHSSVYQVTGREGGGHALYGDPLAVTGSDGGNFLRLTTPPSAVPEPASWALFGLGCVALLRRRRRTMAA